MKSGSQLPGFVTPLPCPSHTGSVRSLGRGGGEVPRIARLFAALALLLLCSLATAADYTELIEDLERDIVRQMRGEDIAGLGIALIDGDEPVLLKTFGYAARKDRVPLVPSTPMAVGDFAKLITTIAVLQLVDDDKITLDDPVTDHLDLTFESRSSDWRAPTVRELLTHHAGFPPNVYADSFRDVPTSEVWLPERLPMTQPPGTIYAYSQLGYQVAGRLVEVVSGQALEAFVLERIAEPLGLDATSFSPTAETAVPHDKRRREKPPLYSRDIAALGLFASLEDLSKLLLWVVGGKGAPLLSDDAVAEMTKVQNGHIALDLDNEAGLGWQLTNTGSHNVDRVYRLNSGIFWHRGLILVAPDQDVAVAVIANSSAAGGPVRDVAIAALDGILEAKEGIEPPPEERPLPESLDLPTGGKPAPMAARYSTAIGELLVEGGPRKWELELAGRTFGAKQREDGWYEISFKLFGVISLRFSILTEILIRPAEFGERRVLLAHFRGSDFLLGTAMPPVPDAARFEPWEGEYRIANPDPVSTNIEIEEAALIVEASRLYLTYELPGVVTLTPRVPLVPIEGPTDAASSASDNVERLYVPGLGINTGDLVTLREDAGRRIIEFSGWRLVRQ